MKKEKCNMLVMPAKKCEEEIKISDEDITALFNGLISVVKRKVELDSRAEIIGYGISIERLTRELKAKTNECNKLKNEIIYLKGELEKNTKNL